MSEPRYLDLTPFTSRVTLTGGGGFTGTAFKMSASIPASIDPDLRRALSRLAAEDAEQRRRDNLRDVACRGCACTTCASTMIDLALHPEPLDWEFKPTP